MNVCCINLASPKLNQQQQNSTYMYQISKIGLGGLKTKGNSTGRCMTQGQKLIFVRTNLIFLGGIEYIWSDR